MAKRPLDLNVRIEGARETLQAFKDLPKEASDALRDASTDLSELMAGWVQAAGRAEGRQAALLAGTVKAKRDRVPYVQAGGTKGVGHAWPKRGKGKAFELLFGSEFGGAGHGFKPHQGKQGTWIFPVIEARASEIAKRWDQAADEVVEKFTAGGPGASEVIG